MVRVRPLESDDLESLEPLVTRGAVSFYARSGHAFVAEDAHGPRGFVLAQAVWDGARATVRLQALHVADDRDDEARAGLLEAVTKSAYDAAVYDLVTSAPEADSELNALLAASGWSPESVVSWRRTLGSRGSS